jgi:diaminopimelate epimerase
MGVRFTKMHGLGNDFMVIDRREQYVDFDSAQVQQWSDRHRGIGFDQLLLLDQTRLKGVDFRYRIFNADGSEVEHCGNGARCVARFAHRASGNTQNNFQCETARGVLTLEVQSNLDVVVQMGVPTFEPSEIPLSREHSLLEYSLDIASNAPQSHVVQFGALAIGNPHAVLTVSEVASAPVAELGPVIERHPDFPNRVNVGFAEKVSANHIRLRVFERGVGETEACGTGACAAAVIGLARGELHNPVTVSLPGGDLQIQWAGVGEQVIMAGPAAFVYDGEISN